MVFQMCFYFFNQVIIPIIQQRQTAHKKKPTPAESLALLY
jgi:hypothetical protein